VDGLNFKQIESHMAAVNLQRSLNAPDVSLAPQYLMSRAIRARMFAISKF
jgi:hypothetical protein